MKRTIAMLIAAFMVLAICACSADEDNLTLAQVSELDRTDLEEKLIGLSQTEIREMWGPPNSMLSGLWGDIYHLGRDDLMIILIYESENGYGKDGRVVDFSITERQIK